MDLTVATRWHFANFYPLYRANTELKRSGYKQAKRQYRQAVYVTLIGKFISNYIQSETAADELHCLSGSAIIPGQKKTGPKARFFSIGRCYSGPMVEQVLLAAACFCSGAS